MPQPQTLRVIIPHYGPDALLQRCLEAVHSCGYPEQHLDIRVIDNNRDNRLFTKGINEGLRGIKPDETAWLLNNDCIPRPGCIDAALRCFAEAGDRCGVVGSKNVGIKDPDRIHWGGSQQCFGILVEHDNSERLLGGVHKTGSVSAGDLATRSQEEWVSFASAFISGALVQEIGLLDENMRHIFSDVDYCMRARWAHWTCWYEPESIVEHDFDSSINARNDALLKVISEDMNWFRLKWAAPTLQSLTRYPIRFKR